MRVMLHDVSDIVSTEPDRFGRRTKAGYTIDSMFKCSFAHVMGMKSHLLEHFSLKTTLQKLIEEDLKNTCQKLNDSQIALANEKQMNTTLRSQVFFSLKN
jgi:hypothetical protein